LAERSEIEQRVGALYSIFASVEASGLEQMSIVRELDVRTDPDAAEHLGLASSASLLYLERLRLAGGDPLAIDRVWMPVELGAPLLQVDFTHTGLYNELADRTGIALTGGRERIRAVVPPEEDRQLLGLDHDTAALAIDRLGLAMDNPVEWRRTYVRGDRFTLLADYSVKDGYQFDLGAVGS
jgi:GntR family transcriptional regulator